MNETCFIDGFGPLPIVKPDGVASIGDLIRQAAARDAALYPVGGQTSIGIGMPPSKAGQIVDMRALARVIDFPARDMTVTVEAGITMRHLSELLARENLRLPIDVPRADRATLGGLIAANVSGPRRFGYGTLRDYVIGISVLNDEGSEFKAGGRVVKNVAGYDLCKLLVGSFGTLGIITQAALKLRPLPELQAVIILMCAPGQLEALLTSLHGSRTRPVSVELLNQSAAQTVFQEAKLAVPEAPWALLVGYEGNADAVAWQVQQLVKEVGTQCRLDGRIDFTARPLCDALVELAALPMIETTFKASLLPSATAAFCQQIDREPQRPLVRAHAANGIVYGHWPSGLTLPQAASMLTTWRELAAKGQGSVIVSRALSEWKTTLAVWGLSRPDAWLLREVKAKFDPKRIFNPGRFVDGI